MPEVDQAQVLRRRRPSAFLWSDVLQGMQGHSVVRSSVVEQNKGSTCRLQGAQGRAVASYGTSRN